MKVSDAKISRFIWRAGLIFSILFLALAALLAVSGEINYRYHLGPEKVHVVIQRESDPGGFWLIAGPLLVASTAAIIFTGVGNFRIRREAEAGTGRGRPAA